MRAKIAIGSAAFGMDYGISNSAGMVSEDEIGRILACGLSKGSELIDTARAYGVSEMKLGRVVETQMYPKIVTKFPSLKNEAVELLTLVNTSLDCLQTSRVYGLLAHNSVDLTGDSGKHVRDQLEELREDGVIEKYGVSVYSPEELERVFTAGDVPLVQLPLNVFDQRFIHSGWLQELERRGVEIHTRSTYLQGLVFMSLEELPSYFDPIRDHLAAFHNAVESSTVSVGEFCRHFVLSQPEVSQVVIGFTDARQIESLNDVEIVGDLNFGDFAIQAEQFINPSLWKLG